MGPSTNSWRVWAQGNDVYIACRDNFQHFKVSLHATGIWRVAFTQEFAQRRSDIVSPGEDRVLKKWQPDLTERMIIGFQIVCPSASLYLGAIERRKWPSSVVFVEQSSKPMEMTVVSVAVVAGDRPVAFKGSMVGAVIGMVPIPYQRMVQIVATRENASEVLRLIEEAFWTAAPSFDRQKLPARGVFFVHGNRGNNIPWVSAVPFTSRRDAPST